MNKSSTSLQGVQSKKEKNNYNTMSVQRGRRRLPNSFGQSCHEQPIQLDTLELRLKR